VILATSFVLGVGRWIVKNYKLIRYKVRLMYCFKKIEFEMLAKALRGEKAPDNYFWIRFDQLFNKRGR
jgi:hypothetical protein